MLNPAIMLIGCRLALAIRCCARFTGFRYPAGQTFCFLTHNDTVVQQPLRLENFTSTITDHALGFFEARAAEPLTPWFFLCGTFDFSDFSDFSGLPPCECQAALSCSACTCPRQRSTFHFPKRA